MVLLSHSLLKVAAVLYFFSCWASIVFPRRCWYALLLVPALATNAAAVVLRYYLAWPMLPMYLTPVALPFLLGTMGVFAGKQDPSGKIRRGLLALSLGTALVAVLFPKDFYLPFVKSQGLWPHLFLIFGALGRTCFLISAAWALLSLFSTAQAKSQRPTLNDHHYFRWAVWGFAFWTLSMFAGELWAYRGWGTPVVWDDPAITVGIATWFFYVCLLHLKLTGTWTLRSRTKFAALGALVVLGLNYLPELGPFRWLW
ncbi:MAG: cytochrome c biogenesis protein CcsA [Desulfosoma sp.]|uniref:cytochrome c biogenesis protein CcsA n=1 Tax=Desulfosoma sp. TaxID=2603217 RepID=UPI0040492CA9